MLSIGSTLYRLYPEMNLLATAHTPLGLDLPHMTSSLCGIQNLADNISYIFSKVSNVNFLCIMFSGWYASHYKKYQRMYS